MGDEITHQDQVDILARCNPDLDDENERLLGRIVRLESAIIELALLLPRQ